MQKIAQQAEFSPDFTWGVATSAFQIEGAHHSDGRADSIWDRFCQQENAIVDGSDGSQACQHYQRLEQDLDLLQEMQIPAYRFSIAWPRVQPLGQGAWNEAGLAFYDRLLDGLAKRQIAAHLTLYHWDLPQALQDEGGWGARSTAYHFAEYALAIAKRYGARVASIATHNEPWVVAVLGHESGIFAPGLKDRRLAVQVSHNLLLSHGLALQAMRGLGLSTPLGIVLNQSPIYPATQSSADLAKAKLEDGTLVRWYMQALMQGSYPADVLTHLGGDAPQIEAGDMALIAQKLDFLGINYYTRNFASSDNPWQPAPGPLGVTAMGWEVYPDGLFDLLTRLQRDYVLPPLYITENGAAYDDELQDGEVHDVARTEYFRLHLAALAKAIAAGVDVRGYFAWSLLDNFEWAMGYTKRFGLVHVDFANQQRTIKDSGKWYRAFIQAQRAEFKAVA